MASAGDVLKEFYEAVVARDLGAARTLLADALVFEGLFTFGGGQGLIQCRGFG